MRTLHDAAPSQAIEENQDRFARQTRQTTNPSRPNQLSNTFAAMRRLTPDPERAVAADPLGKPLSACYELCMVQSRLNLGGRGETSSSFGSTREVAAVRCRVRMMHFRVEPARRGETGSLFVLLDGRTCTSLDQLSNTFAAAGVYFDSKEADCRGLLSARRCLHAANYA